MSTMLLRRLSVGDLGGLSRPPVDQRTLEEARAIVESVARGGEAALRAHAERLGDWSPERPLVYTRQDLLAAAARAPREVRAVLERTRDRIEAFARAQRECLRPLRMAIPGGEAGHDLVPVDAAGCYAPGGRFPLPSSVLMTVVPARVAGVERVWVASPRPAEVTLAAAGVAGADGLLAAGGAQAIAALAFGSSVPRCDVIVGPGNRWVTAAKFVVSDRVGIDMLAGPSELVVLADDAAEAATVAADLLAQAEHDPDAMAVLVTTSARLAEAVERELASQLEELPTREIARASLRAHGGVLVCGTIAEAVGAVNDLAPEHLEVHTREADRVAAAVRHAGAVFIGPGAAEVLGDYGAGPNHVLPTGRTARFRAGLNPLAFLRVRTWMRIDDAPGGGARELLDDAALLARLEGLEGHERSARRRSGG